MTLPASGQITLNQVNVELGNSGTAQISMNDADVRDLFDVASGQIRMSDGYGKQVFTPIGEHQYTQPGTYSWVAPACVKSVSVVAIGAPGMGTTYGPAGGAGGLGYKNNISVTPGASYTVVVGQQSSSTASAGADSYFSSTSVVKGGAGGAGSSSYSGNGGSGGTYTGDGGGNGGNGGNGTSWSGAPYPTGGGGGAGGYSGSGGAGANASMGGSYGGSAGSGGGGGGGASGFDPQRGSGYSNGGGGGGVGFFGQGASGAGGTGTGTSASGGVAYIRGIGGSGGGDGSYSFSGAWGGDYGGSKSNGYADSNPPQGCGAVRIVWGNCRSFPSTNVCVSASCGNVCNN